MTYRTAKAIDLHASKVTISLGGQEHIDVHHIGSAGSGIELNNYIEFDSEFLRELAHIFDIPITVPDGKHWIYPKLYLPMSAYYNSSSGKNWGITELLVDVISVELVNIKVKIRTVENNIEDEFDSEELTYCGPFTVWWSEVAV